MSDTKHTTVERIGILANDAVLAGIEAAAEWVSEADESFLVGNRGWSSKEFQIAELAASEAIKVERERCAKVLERLGRHDRGLYH